MIQVLCLSSSWPTLVTDADDLSALHGMGNLFPALRGLDVRSCDLSHLTFVLSNTMKGTLTAAGIDMQASSDTIDIDVPSSRISQKIGRAHV